MALKILFQARDTPHPILESGVSERVVDPVAVCLQIARVLKCISDLQFHVFWWIVCFLLATKSEEGNGFRHESE